MPHLPDHQADHDPLLIAAFAAGDAEGADLEQARTLVAACDECAALHHDLRAIATALPAVPAATRPRDFRLTPEQAASLRPAGWRRFLAPLGSPRFAFAAPLGGTLAALGLAGVLVAGAASLPIAGTGAGREQARGDAGAAPVTEVQLSAGSEAPAMQPQPSAAAMAPEVGAAGNGAAASASPDDTSVQVPQPTAPSIRYANGGAAEGPKAVPSGAAVAEADGGRTTVVAERPASRVPLAVWLGAAVLLVAGGLLLLGRFLARRVA